ncbi:hypothetical protein [Stenotrophomonas sp. PSU_St99]
MSTDKTLADVQPGGRVRLGDQPERARFEAWAGENYHLQRMGDVYRSAITTDAWRAWQAALSAQPSRGGQAAHCPVKHCGMTYARVPSDGRCHACGATVQPSPGGQGVDPGRVAVEFIAAANFDVPDGYVVEEHLPGIWHYTYTDAGEKMASCASWNNKAHATIAAWQAALAARQPVGEVSVKKEDANNYCLILRALGMEEEGDPVAEVKALIDARDRQPVGEPIGWYTEDHLTDRSATTYDRTVADRWRAKGWPVYPLYGAPPVLFKELQKLRELQAMIGGQAVGK